MKRYYLRDPRQRSPLNGKPEGGWLQVPLGPARWVRRREEAQTFSAEEIEALRVQSPYLDGCEIVPAGQEKLAQ